MAWTEIFPNDTAAMDEFSAVQQTCSDYYARNAKTANYVAQSTTGSMRFFIWRDALYEINLATRLTTDGTKMYMKVVGIGMAASYAIAAGRILLKLKAVMGEYGVKTLVSKYKESDILQKTKSFYEAMTAGLVAAGFINVSVTTDANGKVESNVSIP